MSALSRPHNTPLPLDAQRRIAEACAHFDQGWRAGNRPRIEDYLSAGDGDDEQRELLRALLEVEFFYRRLAPEGFSLDEYLARFSEQADLVREVFAPQTVAASDPGPMPSSEPGPVGPDEVGVVAAGLPAFLGRYRVTGTLGTGTFGVVYRARDEQLRRDVAIKVPRPELVESLGGIEAYLKEARVVAALEHPNIVPVHDVDHTPDGLCYVVFGFIDGSDLRSRLKQGPGFSPAEAARLVAALAGALQHAHQEGIYHRDLKPANILLDRSGKPHLTDFGLAQKQEDYGKGPSFAGTLAYMSPEQARRESHRVDGRTDVFSLGAVFYEMLTGQRPFQGSREEILDRIANGEARPPRELVPTIPAELERICLKAMARSLSDRYTAAALASDFQAWLDEDTKQSASHPQAGQQALAHAVFFLATVILTIFGWYVGGQLGGGTPLPPVQQLTPGTTTPGVPHPTETIVIATPYRFDEVLAALRRQNPGFTGKDCWAMGSGDAVNLWLADERSLKTIAPLRDLKFSVTHLFIDGTSVADLSPLRGKKSLSHLSCNRTLVEDLSPLQDLQLKSLELNETRVKSLEPLRRMPLTSLACYGMATGGVFANTTRTRRIPLTSLACFGTEVADLSPLQGMRLETLNCANTRVKDLSPLEGMPLVRVTCDEALARDPRSAFLKKIKTLQTINEMRAAEFWQQGEP